MANRAGLNQWYTLRAKASGNSLHGEYTYNGVTTTLDVTDLIGFSSGSVGFRATGGDYHFDNALMEVKTTYSYNAANGLTQIADASAGGVNAFAYDNAGNNITDGSTSRTYDERNRLTSVTGSGLNVSYSYDGLGNLLTRNNQNLTGNMTTYRYNDVTGTLLNELNSPGSVKATYVTDDKGNPVSVTRYNGGTPVSYFYHVNAHGDVMSITDSQGNTVASFSYDAWGKPTEFGAGGAPENIGTWTTSTGGTAGDGLFILFGSMLYDAATGLYLTKSRAYNPVTRRFLERDTIMQQDRNGSYVGFPFGKDAIGVSSAAKLPLNSGIKCPPS